LSLFVILQTRLKIVPKPQYQVGRSPVSYLGMQVSNPRRKLEVVGSTSNKATTALSFHVISGSLFTNRSTLYSLIFWRRCYTRWR